MNNMTYSVPFKYSTQEWTLKWNNAFILVFLLVLLVKVDFLFVCLFGIAACLHKKGAHVWRALRACVCVVLNSNGPPTHTHDLWQRPSPHRAHLLCSSAQSHKKGPPPSVTACFALHCVQVTGAESSVGRYLQMLQSGFFVHVAVLVVTCSTFLYDRKQCLFLCLCGFKHRGKNRGSDKDTQIMKITMIGLPLQHLSTQDGFYSIFSSLWPSNVI